MADLSCGKNNTAVGSCSRIHTEVLICCELSRATSQIKLVNMQQPLCGRGTTEHSEVLQLCSCSTHIMNIQAQKVPQPMRHEHPVHPSSSSGLHTAPHNTQLLQLLQQKLLC